MQIDTVTVRVNRGTSEVVGARGEGVLEVLGEAQKKMQTVSKSTSMAVNQPELVALLDKAIEAGQRNLDKILRDAKQIGGDLQRAMKDPESLTVAHNKARESDKGMSV